MIGPGLLGVTWTDAAIIAAAVAGAFTLTKEVLSFGLDRLKEWLNRRLARQRIYARVAQHYFQLAVGAGKALVGFESIKADLQQIGAPGPLPPPNVDFLAQYDDPTLASDVIELAAESPESVTNYLHALTVKKGLMRICREETEEFGAVPTHFTYPRTRNALRGLLKDSIDSLQGVNKQLSQRARRNYHNWARDHLVPILDSIPEVTRAELIREALSVRAAKGNV